MHVKGFNPRYLAECTGESYLLFLYRQQGRRSADYCGNSGLLTRKTKQLLEVRHLAIWFVRIRPLSWRHVPYFGAASGTCLCTKYIRANVTSVIAITR
jgi:hypothetical protein